MRVAEMAASKMAKKYPGWLTPDDAAGSAYLGMCKAALKWRPGKGSQFSTFAWRGALQQIKDDAKDLGPLIHIPRHMFNKKKEREKVYKKAGNAKIAEQNRFCMRQALHVGLWTREELDELQARAMAPHHSTA